MSESYAQFELNHTGPIDNVYDWFRYSITDIAVHPEHTGSSGYLTALADGWKRLQTYGPGSDQLHDWFDDAIDTFSDDDGTIADGTDPIIGSGAHRSTITHLHRFEREYGGHVDQVISRNVAKAFIESQLAQHMSPLTVRNITYSPRRITITPHHDTGWLAVRDRNVLGLVVKERDEAEDFAAWWQHQPIDVDPEDFYLPRE